MNIACQGPSLKSVSLIVAKEHNTKDSFYYRVKVLYGTLKSVSLIVTKEHNTKDSFYYRVQVLYGTFYLKLFIHFCFCCSSMERFDCKILSSHHMSCLSQMKYSG